MRMAPKFQKKGFEVTCPAEFRQGRSGGHTDLVFWVRIRLGAREDLGILDTRATISIVAKKTLPRGDLKNILSIPQPFAWEMGMWWTAVGTVRSMYLWNLGALPIGST